MHTRVPLLRTLAILATLALATPALTQVHEKAGRVHVGKGKYVDVSEAPEAGFVFHRDRWVPKKLERKLRSWERADAKVKSWSDAYRTRSKHYRICTNAPRYVVELELKPFLDELYRSYVEVFKRDYGLSSRAANKNEICIYWGFETWKHVHGRDRSNPGFYVPDGALHVLYDPCDPDDFYNTVFHEGAHQFFYATLPGAELPVWLDEALATYFEGFVYNRSLCKVQPHYLPPSRLASAKSLILAQRKAGKEVTPSAMFLHIPGIDSFDAGHYALAWSFVYYLIHKNDGKHRKLFTKWLRALNGSGVKPAAEVFREECRKELSDYEKGWADWVLALESPQEPRFLTMAASKDPTIDIQAEDLLYSIDGQWVDSEQDWKRLWVDRDRRRPTELVLLRRSDQGRGWNFSQQFVHVTLRAGSEAQLDTTGSYPRVRNVID